MDQYELTILLKNTMEEKIRKGLLDDVVKDFGNKLKEDLWGVRSLAYPIMHADKAYYAYYEFQSDPGTIPALDKKLRLNEDIIRYLLIKSKIVRRKTKVKVKIAKAEVKDKVEEEVKE